MSSGDEEPPAGRPPSVEGSAGSREGGDAPAPSSPPMPAASGEDAFGTGTPLHLDRLLMDGATRITHEARRQPPPPQQRQQQQQQQPSAPPVERPAAQPGTEAESVDGAVGRHAPQPEASGAGSLLGPKSDALVRQRPRRSSPPPRRPPSAPPGPALAEPRDRRDGASQRAPAHCGRLLGAPSVAGGTSVPRPHPFHLRPQHCKTNYRVPTADGWRLRLIRTQRLSPPPSRAHPVLLVPGLGSSGAYSFDLSPGVSLADYLAERGWEVWTAELRGNGASDKPSLSAGRSRWWTIDDYVERDVPTLIRYVLRMSNAHQVHLLGHSMGGMIMCGVMARADTTTGRVRSAIAVGSGLFLEDSGWRRLEALVPAARAMWVLPTGRLLRLYSRLLFTPLALPWLDRLYFWPGNAEPRVARALMRRNFSNISPGVIVQMATAFKAQGLLSSDHQYRYADPGRLSRVKAPLLFLVGDKDTMCPPTGARRTWELFGSPDKRFVVVGPSTGFSSHYGHFDILMGLRVESEVFPLIHGFLAQHDAPLSRL